MIRIIRIIVFMASFFEKLKKGMGVEEEVKKVAVDKSVAKKSSAIKKTAEDKEKIATPQLKSKRQKKMEIKSEEVEPEIKEEAATETQEVKAEENEPFVPEITEEKTSIEIKNVTPPVSSVLPEDKSASVKTGPEKEQWFESEGQLAIDVYQTENDFIIQSAIAGVKAENLDLVLEGDRVTIKGSREKPNAEEGDYFTQECYWGLFSREVILPVEVDPNRAAAEIKEGILTIRIPMIQREKRRKIVVSV